MSKFAVFEKFSIEFRSSPTGRKKFVKLLNLEIVSYSLFIPICFILHIVQILFYSLEHLAENDLMWV